MLTLPGDLVIESVTCPFDSVVLNQAGIPVTIRVRNSSNTTITVHLLQLIFSENTTGDRNTDYVVTGDLAPEVTIPSGGSFDFEVDVQIDQDAVTDRNIRIDAYAFGQRLDNLETVSDSTSSDTVIDRFDAVSFDGNNGSVDWEIPWREEGGEDDGPAEGVVTVIPSPVPEMGLSLAIGAPSFGPGSGASREVDLTGANSARLAFNWQRDPVSGFFGTNLLVQVSGDGVVWDDLMVINGGSDPTPYIFSFDITPYIGPDTQIRFITEGTGSGVIYIDNIVVNYATETGAFSWVVLAEAFTAIIALFDTRMTTDRSDDSLMVLREGEIFQLDTDYHVASGSPIANIPFETGRRYRFVIQLHSFSDWDWAPKEEGRGWLALVDSSQGFGRLLSPQPGISEFLLTETVIADEESDPIDYLVGASNNRDPPVPWNMYSDPWSDIEIDNGKLGEFGQLLYGLDPARWHIDCRDGGKDWEVTGQCEDGRYYFHEVWFTPDLEWTHGDVVDVHLMIEGESGHGDIPGLHTHFRMVDDDTAGPAITDFTPELVREGETFRINCRINDPSGVFDDGSGSSGQGVYLIWDTDGDLENGHNEDQMSRVIEDLFETDIVFPGFTEGDEITYRVYAYDDDSDTGPADRSLTASGTQRIAVAGTIALFDKPHSLWPERVYPAEQSVPFYIDLTNPNADGIRLWTSSFILFTDGAETVTTFLSNTTSIGAGVSGFPVRFDDVDIPASFNSPDTVDIIVYMEGVYDDDDPYNQMWTASYTNRLIVMQPLVHFDAHPVPSVEAHPGDELVELIRMEVSCESITDITFDSLVVSDIAPAGSRSAAERSDNIETVYLYRQVSSLSASHVLKKASAVMYEGGPEDIISNPELFPPYQGPSPAVEERGILTDRPFSQSDSLVSTAYLDNGRAIFRLAGGRLLEAWESSFFYVVADIDSFDAVDGDPLEFGITSPDSVFISGNALVSLVDDPFVSEGTPVIDGFMTFQASLVSVLPETLYSGEDYALVMAIDVPSNGNTPDIISALTVVNLGDAAALNALDAVGLWADDGNGAFSVYSDIYVGNLQYTGDRFEMTGLSIPVAGSQRLFVTADIGSDFALSLQLRMGIPPMGIEYISGNDGPIDGGISPDSSQVLIRREFVYVESLLASPELAPVRPGDRDVELMAIRISNNTLGSIVIDSMRVSGAADLFTCEPVKPIHLHVDDGNGIFDPGSDSRTATCSFSGGSGLFGNMDIDIPYDEKVVIFVAADMDSSMTVDGNTLSLGLISADDIHISAVTSGIWDIDGIFPAGNLNPRVTDGMLAHQLTVHTGTDTTIAGRREDILVLDFLVPGNGCLDDTLSAISLENIGTAGSEHIGRMLLWKDDGDGLFDPAIDDSVALLSPMSSQKYEASSLSIPLDGATGSRFFASIDLLEGFRSGATIRAGIPQMGIEVMSGNDGPMDEGVYDDNTIVIPIPDRITFFASSLGNKQVHAGDTDVLNMVIGAYNSYGELKTLGSIVLLKGGTSKTNEITNVRAWVDNDEDGLFDPTYDGLLLEIEPSSVLIPLEGLGFEIDPLKSSLLFITYSVPSAGVRDSVSVDFSISDASLIGFEGGDIKVEGDFPLNSAGTDLTDGMIAAQIDLIPVPGGRVSPGDLGVPCLSLRIPCNGSESDYLKNFSLVNDGTCLPGADIDYLRLWMESGGSGGSYDPGEEIFLDHLVWDGIRWSSVSGLSVPIDCAGLTLHVTADFASSAADGRTLRTAVPVDGIEVLSGNDGPIDLEIISASEILVTTIPLLVSFEPLASVTLGQEFDIQFVASNVSDTVLTAVEPDSFDWSGDGGATLISGPVPISTDLPGGTSSTFTWTLTADGPGRTVFRSRAVERGGSAVSWFEFSDTLIIEEIPDFVNVTIDDLAPVSLNRGHRDATLFEIMLTYGSSCSGCATVELSSLEGTFMDDQGLPIPVSSVASRVFLEDESMVIYSCDTADSTGSSLTLVPAARMLLRPGEARTLRFSIDVSDTASAGVFSSGIVSASGLLITDTNNGRSVAFGGAGFPWTTNAISLKDPVTELSVELQASLPPEVNKGQEDVGIFNLVLTSNGGPSASDISISSVRFATFDGSGSASHPGGFFRNFLLQDDLGFAYFSTETFPAPDAILCEFQPELKVSPGMPVTLKAVIDCLSDPETEAFSIAIEDSIDVSARDFNSGNPVEILPGGSSNVFPMMAGPAHFIDPLTGFSISGSGVLPGSLIAGMTGVDAIMAGLSHTGSTGESPAVVSSVTIRLLDHTGTGLSPSDYLDAVRIKMADTTAGAFFVSAADTTPYIEIPLQVPLVLGSGESADILIKCDFSVSASPGMFQMMISTGGFDVRDATDGKSFTSIEGEFPVTSGLAQIVLPAEMIRFAAVSKLDPNAASGEEVHVFDAHFKREDASGGSDVRVESLRLEILDEGGEVSDPSQVVESVRFGSASGDIPITVSTNSGGFTAVIDDPPGVTGDGTFDFSIYLHLKDESISRAFSVRIAAPADISCSDEVTGETVAVQALQGNSFPFVTSRAALLAATIAESFSNYPNPFVPARERTTVTFYLPEPATVSLEIYTILGRLVTKLVHGKRLEAGLHQDLYWDGRNGNGDPVVSGVYLMVLSASNGGREEVFRRKVSLVR